MGLEQETGEQPSSPIWVLFKTQYEDEFDYKEIEDNGKRTLLVFTTLDRAADFASKYAKDYRAISFDIAELRNDFFKRRANAGVSHVAIDPSSPAIMSQVQGIDAFTTPKEG